MPEPVRAPWPHYEMTKQAYISLDRDMAIHSEKHFLDTRPRHFWSEVVPGLFTTQHTARACTCTLATLRDDQTSLHQPGPWYGHTIREALPRYQTETFLVRGCTRVVQYPAHNYVPWSLCIRRYPKYSHFSGFDYIPYVNFPL